MRALFAFVLLLATPALNSCARPQAGEPALWRIADSDSEIWLFGTAHMLRPELRWRGPTEAFDAWAARDASFSMVIAGISPDPKDADALKAWGRAYWKAVHPYNMGGGYVNFMFDDEVDGRLQATYGENYSRLAVVKAKYDPTNLFRVNQNIAPAAAV